jgi:hypothetical protein
MATIMIIVRIVVRTSACGDWATIIADNRFSSEGWVDRAGPSSAVAGVGAKSGERDAATGGRGYDITSER